MFRSSDRHRLAVAEDRGADAHMGRAEFNRRLEIAAHAHAEMLQGHCRCASLASSAKCGAASSSAGGMHIRPSHRQVLVPRIGDQVRPPRAATPAFCGSSPVLTCTNRRGALPLLSRSAARASASFSRSKFGSRRTAPPPRALCWSAAGRSINSGRRRSVSGLVASSALPARGFRRRGAGPPPVLRGCRPRAPSLRYRHQMGTRRGRDSRLSRRRDARRYVRQIFRNVHGRAPSKASGASQSGHAAGAGDR